MGGRRESPSIDKKRRKRTPQLLPHIYKNPTGGRFSLTFAFISIYSSRGGGGIRSHFLATYSYLYSINSGGRGVSEVIFRYFASFLFCTPQIPGVWGSGLSISVTLQLQYYNPVMIRVRIGPPHPLVCRKRRLIGDLWGSGVHVE